MTSLLAFAVEFQELCRKHKVTVNASDGGWVMVIPQGGAMITEFYGNPVQMVLGSEAEPQTLSMQAEWEDSLYPELLQFHCDVDVQRVIHMLTKLKPCTSPQGGSLKVTVEPSENGYQMALSVAGGTQQHSVSLTEDERKMLFQAIWDAGYSK